MAWPAPDFKVAARKDLELALERRGEHKRGIQGMRTSPHSRTTLELRWSSPVSFNAVQSFLRLNMPVKRYETADLDIMEEGGPWKTRQRVGGQPHWK
jgi:hypothetical protein